LIGAFDSFKPKFAKRYENIAAIETKAFEDYASEVRGGIVSDSDHSYSMKDEK